MKKRILFSVLLAVVLTVCFVTPVAAGPSQSKVVDIDRYLDTQTYSSYDGPYLVEDVFHVNAQIIQYSDGSIQNNFNVVANRTWYDEGVEIGTYHFSEKFFYTYNWETMEVNQHNFVFESATWDGSIIFYNFSYIVNANGEIRVDFVKIQ